MKVKVKEEKEREIEIPVPSYWQTKSGYNHYFVHQRPNNAFVFVDQVEDYQPTNHIGFHANHSMGIIPWGEVVPSTKEEFETALDKVIHAIETIINETDKSCGDDSFWMLRRELGELHKEESTGATP